MNELAYKRILLGVTGGIAAYKSADLVRRLREQDAEVRVVMTANACEFITPLTLQALSGHPVRTDLFDPAAEAAMSHIELARWAEAVVIAPASASFLARLAHGLADDLLSTLCLATRAPVTVAPAMNREMWLAAATQANLTLLQHRSVRVIGPADGSQACGEFGPGRMLEPPEIVAALETAAAESGLLAGRTVLITAGPTREPIDPVRYLSNRSSGKMGYALARACIATGADVVLISGPVQLAPPPQAQFIGVGTAAEMAAAVERMIESADIFISAAAVADYRCDSVASQKMKRNAEGLTLALTPNIDIVAAVAARSPRPFIVGFAAETENLPEHAREKLVRKRLDMIAANDVSRPGLGFDSDENAVQVFWDGGGATLERTNKDAIAGQLINIIAERYGAESRAQNS